MLEGFTFQATYKFFHFRMPNLSLAEVSGLQFWHIRYFRQRSTGLRGFESGLVNNVKKMIKIRAYHALRYKFHEFFIHFLVYVLQFGQARERNAEMFHFMFKAKVQQLTCYL